MRTGKRRSAVVIISRGLPGIVLLFLWGSGSPVNLGFEDLAQVAPADLDVAVFGQYAVAELAFGDALEPGPL